MKLFGVEMRNFHYGWREHEFNFIGRVWNFRIGTHQIALWRNYEPVFSFRRALRALLIPLAFILPILAACTPRQTNNAASCAASLSAVPAKNAADLFMAAQQSPACVAAGIDLMQQAVMEIMARRGFK